MADLKGAGSQAAIVRVIGHLRGLRMVLDMGNILLRAFHRFLTVLFYLAGNIENTVMAAVFPLL